MSKWPMRGHFRYLRSKTFPMTPRTRQFKVFWALLSNSKHSGDPEDSKSPTLEVLGFTPTLGQSGVATPLHMPGFQCLHNPRPIFDMSSVRAAVKHSGGVVVFVNDSWLDCVSLWKQSIDGTRLWL
jgi:hypothetical protein